MTTTKTNNYLNTKNKHLTCDSHTIIDITKKTKSIKKLKTPTMRYSMDQEEFFKRLMKGTVTNSEIVNVFSDIPKNELDLYLPDEFSKEKKNKIIKIIEFYRKDDERLNDLKKIVDEPSQSENSNYKNDTPNKTFSNEQIESITNFLKSINDISLNPLSDTIMKNINLINSYNDNSLKTANKLILSKSLYINKKWNIINNENNLSSEKKVNKKEQNFITITNIEESNSLRNPIKLSKKIKSTIDENQINDAKILRSGDLRIWFKNDKQLKEAKKNSGLLKKLGEKASLKYEKSPNKTIVIHRLPKEITNDDIDECLKSNKIEFTSIRTTKAINRESKTAFVCITSNYDREKLISEKKIKLGITFFPISIYKSPDVFQCYKCYKIGHMAKNCSNNIRCLICSENHKYEECKRRNNPKCSLCDGNHISTFRNCPEKMKYLKNKKMTEDSNKKTNRQNKSPWIPINKNEIKNKFLEKRKIFKSNQNENNKNTFSIEFLNNKIEKLSGEVKKISELRESFEKMSALLKGLLL